MRHAFGAALLVLASLLSGAPAPAQEESQGSKTFRALLFLVPATDESAGGGVRVEHLKEVWTEGESAAKLRARLTGVDPRQLQALTIVPGQKDAVVQYEDVTFRIAGLYRGAQKDRMYLKVSFDQAGQAAMKEFLAGLDESVLVAYPLIGDGAGSIIALLIPTG